MKKYLKIAMVSSFLFWGLNTIVAAQKTYIPDDNFEQKLIDLGIDSDGMVNDSMLTSDALWIWGLDVSNSSISDLTGIEIFPNIASLDVQGNSLTTLDVTSNISLKWLNCYDNNLTSLNTSGLTLLETINCRGNAISPTIDVSSSLNLTHLYCYSNQLKSLDLSNNTNLVLLHAQTNNLGFDDVNALNMKNGNNANVPTANFDIRWNWNTLCIDVDDVAYSNTNWTNYQSAHMTYSLDCASAAPITLVHFDGKVIEDFVLLEWETMSEINNKGFEINRSKDGNNWEFIGFVNGSNHSNRNIQYQFSDTNPYKGKTYYRLKQIDYDGQYTFFNTIMIEKSENRISQIFPNPSTGIFNFVGIDKNTPFIIQDKNGKVLKNEMYEGQPIDISMFPSGVYFLTLDLTNEQKSYKLLKK